MKKFLLSALLSLATMSAQAQEVVTVMYSWSPADSITNINRHTIAEANRIQNKYKFIFDAKPGAGGTLAANHVLSNPNQILVTSSAFFVRAAMFPDASYDLSKFTTLMGMCTAPMSITSSKYKSWKEVPNDKPLNIGTSGLGVTTHLAALQVVAQYPNMQVVPFKSTSEAFVNMVGGSVDFQVGFLSEPEAWGKENNRPVHVMGITGNRSVNGHATLASQGFDPITNRIEVPFHYVVPASVSTDKYNEWRSILQKAAKSKQVRESMSADYCFPTEDLKAPKQWYSEQAVFWRKLSSGVSVNK
ncbi:Bordetella uptake gene [uncultured Caudovirales phage]|uniref:Bordetella uptake protein n=1 Tax=uncultured Caudovirales phage TaxID=2100421 RepID=A0A6J5LTQ1_9CAUD|nr:Bordetella uptake gene [uncultured Caudovirales phage]